MAVQERVASITVNPAAGSTRTFTATAAVRDTAAGGSVSITVVSNLGGVVTPPDAPDSLILKMVNTAGSALLAQYTFTTAHPTTAGSTQQVFTFFFTTDGTSGGSPRAGTVELVLEAIRSGGSPTSRYDVQSDGSNAANTAAAVPPSGGSFFLDRGWIRGTTTATVTTSNVSAGGAKPSKYVYATPVGGDGGDSIFHRIVLAHPTYESWTAVHTVSGASPALSQSSGAAATQTFDATMTRVVDGRFPASQSTQTASVGTVPNATLNNSSPNTGGGTTGVPYVGLTTINTDSLTIDPRLTVEHLLYLNLSSYQTPPLSRHTADLRRRQSELAYLGTNVRNANGSKVGNTVSGGVNGVSLTTNLVSQVDPTNVVTQSNATTGTQAGETGWTPLFSWSNSLPGGIWNKTVTIGSGTTDLTNGHLVGATAAHTLIARNDDLLAVCIIGTDDPDNHLTAGKTLDVDAWLIDMAQRIHVAADEVTAVIRRMSSTGEAQFWDGAAWQNAHDGAGGTVVAPLITLTKRPNQFVWTVSIPTSAAWANDPTIIVRVTKDGVFYPATDLRELVGTANSHNGYAFDPVGLFK